MLIDFYDASLAITATRNFYSNVRSLLLLTLLEWLGLADGVAISLQAGVADALRNSLELHTLGRRVTLDTWRRHDQSAVTLDTWR